MVYKKSGFRLFIDNLMMYFLGPKVAETAANKAGAYGGSEIGSKVGGVVGPPIIGGIAGNIIGEKLGEKAVQNTGITRRVGQAR